jgi:chromosome segregation ATPase
MGIREMALKNIWSKTSDWFRSKKAASLHQPEVTPEGLISEADEGPPAGEVAVTPARTNDKAQSLEKLQEGFNRLINQLEGINEHLGRQADRQERLMEHLEKLPDIIDSFPKMVENQKQLTEQTLEQLKANSLRSRQFLEIMEKIPAETARQTDALASIDNQLAAAASVDAQMSETFSKFSETLGKLNENTVGQTDSIMQMSKTFATSDRYLKYLMNVQNRRFMWLFLAAIGVCLLAIIILTAVIVYIR